MAKKEKSIPLIFGFPMVPIIRLVAGPPNEFLPKNSNCALFVAKLGITTSLK